MKLIADASHMGRIVKDMFLVSFQLIYISSNLNIHLVNLSYLYGSNNAKRLLILQYLYIFEYPYSILYKTPISSYSVYTRKL